MNELTGYVDLSDLNETWIKSLLHISASKCVFSVTSHWVTAVTKIPVVEL